MDKFHSILGIDKDKLLQDPLLADTKDGVNKKLIKLNLQLQKAVNILSSATNTTSKEGEKAKSIEDNIYDSLSDSIDKVTLNEEHVIKKLLEGLDDTKLNKNEINSKKLAMILLDNIDNDFDNTDANYLDRYELSKKTRNILIQEYNILNDISTTDISNSDISQETLDKYFISKDKFKEADFENQMEKDKVNIMFKEYGIDIEDDFNYDSVKADLYFGMSISDFESYIRNSNNIKADIKNKILTASTNREDEIRDTLNEYEAAILTNNQTIVEKNVDENYKLKDIRVYLIGDPKKKYQLDQNESKGYNKENSEGNEEDIEYDKDYIPTEKILSTLEEIGGSTKSFDNESSAIELKKGEFYNIQIDLDINTIQLKNLNFQLDLQKTTGDANPINLDSLNLDIKEKGKYTIDIDTLIPANIKNGKYRLFSYMNNVSREEVTKNSFAGTFVNIVDGDESKDIQVVDSLNNKYIDLKLKEYFHNGYTRDLISKTSLIIYNTKGVDEKVKVRATLKIKEKSYILGLLNSESEDETKSDINDELSTSIPKYEPSNPEGSDKTFNWFIKEADYKTILKDIPDLSRTLDSDGEEAKIVWTIKSETTSTNVVYEETYLFSKFLEDFELKDDFSGIADEYYDDEYYGNLDIGYEDDIDDAVQGKTTLRNLKVARGIEYSKNESTEFSLINTSNKFVKDWNDIKNIKNFKLNNAKIDAALDYDDTYVFLFIDDKYLQYNKHTGTIDGALKKIKDKWPHFAFKKIDAAVRWDEKLYFFKGLKYFRIVKGSEEKKGVSVYNINKNWHNDLANFAPLDAAVRGQGGKNKYIYFLKGDDYVRYEFSEDKVSSGYPQKIEKNWGDLEDNVNAGAYLKDGKFLLIKNGNSVARDIINNGILFKFEGEFNKTYGNKKTVALAFENEFGTVAKWVVPNINASASAAIKLYLFKHPLTLLGVEAEAGAGINKIHPKAKKNKKDNSAEKEDFKSRVGAKISATALTYTFFEKDTITDTDADEIIQETSIYAKPEDQKTPEEKKEEDLRVYKKREELKKEEEELAKKKALMPDYKWEQEKIIFHQRFVVGVPVYVAFGVKGKLQIKTGVSFEGVGLVLNASTPSNVGILGRGGITGGIVKVGIEVDATVIEAKGEAGLKGGLKLNSKNEFAIFANARADADLKILKADMNLVGQIRAVKFWGTYWAQKTWPIYTTPWLFRYKWNLLNKDLFEKELFK